MCYDYLFSFAQGDFSTSTSGRQTPSSLVLELYHPVWIVVKHYPEVIATVHGCEKHFVTCVLLDDAGLDLTHKVGKAILCFL